jgi:glycosyltransferase involved in cell wall biosynthesis
MARFYGYEIFEGILWDLHRLAYQQGDCVLATSHQVVKELTEQRFGEVRLWRRGVDWEIFSPEFATPEMRNRLSDNHPERTLLLSVGRLAPEKQVEQIKAVLDTVPNTHLAIVGDGPYRKRLEEIYDGYPVTFVGYMSGMELSCAYASSDIFVFPTSSIETCGLVAAEAMASGIPVVASRVGGLPEIVQQGVNGYMFTENDVQQMVAYVRELVEHPEKRQQMSVAARESVADLSWISIMDDLFELYEEVIREYAETSQKLPASAI